MDKKISWLRIDSDFLLVVYRRLAAASGEATMAALSREMERLGIYNRRTGKPFSRQAYYYALAAIPGALPLLRRGVGLVHDRPVICSNPQYPNITSWFKRKMPDIQVIEYDQITLDDAYRRVIYGAPPIGCMGVAAAVYWIYHERRPLRFDAVPLDDGTYYLRRMVWQDHTRHQKN